MGHEKGKSCVLMGCDKGATGACDSCGMPVCERHSRRTVQSHLCVNCLDCMRRLKAKAR